MGKNRDTKQKEPIGQGKLYIYNGAERKNIIEITGSFAQDNIYDAVLFIQGEKVYQGELEYSYQYDKKEKKLQLSVDLTKGVLYIPFGYNEAHRIKIPEDAYMRYTFIIEKGNTYPLKFNITPSNRKFTFYNDVFDPTLGNTLRQIIAPHLKRNKWVATWNDKTWNGLMRWESKWISSELDNNFTLSNNPLRVTGNDSKCSYDNNSFKVKLADNGYFEYDLEKGSAIIFPNGDKFTGSFQKVPFSFEKKRVKPFDAFHETPEEYEYRKSLFDKGDRVKGTNANLSYALIEVFINLNNNTTSDFVLGDGEFKHSSGETERVKAGRFIDQKTIISKNGKAAPTYKDIVGNAVDIRDKEQQERFEALCKRDFWAYIGKSRLSELDKEIFKKNEEYAQSYEKYKEALNNGVFYTISGFHFSDYTPTGARYWKSRTWDNSNPFADPAFSIMQIRYNMGIPVTKTCQRSKDAKFSSDPGILLTVPTKDLDFLKNLETYEKSGEIGILAIFKPGVEIEYNEHGSKAYIVEPIGMYLINDKTNTILYDFTQYIDKSSLNKHITTSKQVVRRAKSTSHSSTYHSVPIKEHCYECGGDGIVEGTNLYGVPGLNRTTCRNCKGKGYTLNHYY